VPVIVAKRAGILDEARFNGGAASDRLPVPQAA